jgi:hypothetical protein
LNIDKSATNYQIIEVNMKKMVLVIALILQSVTYSQTTIAKYAGEFLAIGVGGRSAGMGGAQVAIVNDVTAAYWNPAALARVDYPQFALMHEEKFGNLLNYNYAAVAFPFDENMTFAISAIRLGIDGIPDTRNALFDGLTGEPIDDIQNPNSRLDYSKITEFSNVDYAMYLSFAKRETSEFYWGVNAKFIKRDIAEYSAWGIGFDVGAWYNPTDNLFFGANLMDVTTTMVAWSPTGKIDLISPTLKTGVGYQIQFGKFYAMPSLDLDIRFENRQYASNFNIGPISFDQKIGFEFAYNNLVALRMGYTDVQQFSIGTGIKLPKLNVDYSFARFNGSADETLGDSHRISIILTLEETRFLRK